MRLSTSHYVRPNIIDKLDNENTWILYDYSDTNDLRVDVIIPGEPCRYARGEVKKISPPPISLLFNHFAAVEFIDIFKHFIWRIAIIKSFRSTFRRAL